MLDFHIERAVFRMHRLDDALGKRKRIVIDDKVSDDDVLAMSQINEGAARILEDQLRTAAVQKQVARVLQWQTCPIPVFR